MATIEQIKAEVGPWTRARREVAELTIESVVEVAMAVLPPAELSARVVPRAEAAVVVAAPARPRTRNHQRAAPIDWQALVVATWMLGEGEQYTGTLPDRVTQHWFNQVVHRAASGLGGEVGLRVRGRQWWCWSQRKGDCSPAPLGHPKQGRWKQLWRAVDQAQVEGRDSVEIPKLLSPVEHRRLMEAAGHRRMRVRLQRDEARGVTIVRIL